MQPWTEALPKRLFSGCVHTGEETGVLGVGSIPVAILPSCQDMKLLHYNCINMHSFR